MYWKLLAGTSHSDNPCLQANKQGATMSWNVKAHRAIQKTLRLVLYPTQRNISKACAGTTIRKKDEKEHAALPKPTPVPYQQTNLEGRGKACAMTRKWNRQRYILLWQPFQLKNKQNRTGHKLYANWYNQRINATVNIIWHHTRKCTSPRRKAERCSDAALWGSSTPYADDLGFIQ